MRVAIMQPYFLPYIGYFQLIRAVDVFVVYDNIKYTKSGWINRNRMLNDGKDVVFSLPLKSASDYCNVVERELAASFDRRKLLNQMTAAYRRAPYFAQTLPLLERVLLCDENNLFRFIKHSLIATCEHLGIATEFLVSSTIAIDHSLKSQDKVLALCTALGATTYINAIGGRDLYAKGAFKDRGVELLFIQPKPFVYRQFENEFVPWLSIVDVLMFAPYKQVVAALTENYELI